MKKKIGLGLLASLAIATTLCAAPIPYTVSDFISKGTNFSGGYVQKSNGNFYKTSLGTNLSLGIISLGAGLNYYAPAESSNKSYTTLTVHHVGFDIPNLASGKWGRLSNISLGQGLLMDNYDTGRIDSSADLSPEQAGIYGSLTLSPVKLEALRNSRGLYATRLAYTLPQATLGLPLTVGGTYINDPKTPGKTTEQAAYAGDFEMPLMGSLVVFNGEYAKLDKNGDGISVGFKGNLAIANYRVAFRQSKNFIPNYFSDTYEQSPSKIPTDNITVSGYLATIGTSWFDNMIASEITYEQYKDINTLSAGLGWKSIAGVAGVAHYTKPLSGLSVVPQLDAQLLISNGSFPIDGLVGIRQTYYTNRTETTYAIGGTVSLTRVMGLPF